MADVGCEIAVCWEMSRVNSRVIIGMFDCFITRNAAVSGGPDKDYVEVGGSADEGVRGVNVLDGCKGGEGV